MVDNAKTANPAPLVCPPLALSGRNFFHVQTSAKGQFLTFKDERVLSRSGVTDSGRNSSFRLMAADKRQACDRGGPIASGYRFQWNLIFQVPAAF
jgi:hypothetical protein